MTGHWYHAYGLRICSQLPLPAPQSAPADTADAVFRFGDAGVPATADKSKTLLVATPTEICCHWKSAGTFSVRSGREIIIEPNPTADEQTLAAWLQGAAMSLLLHQRGLLVLHASGVGIDGHAAAFCGEVGWGKSTTATAFCAHGHQLLSDDVIAVDFSSGTAMTVPGFPHVKLLPESARHFGADHAAMLNVAGEAEKRLRVLDKPLDQTPVPLRAVYILGEPGETEFPCIEPLPSQTAMLQLMRHAFVARMTGFLRDTGTAVSHFANCTRLVNTANVAHLLRPRSLEMLPQLVDLIEHELAAGVCANEGVES